MPFHLKKRLTNILCKDCDKCAHEIKLIKETLNRGQDLPALTREDIEKIAEEVIRRKLEPLLKPGRSINSAHNAHDLNENKHFLKGLL